MDDARDITYGDVVTMPVVARTSTTPAIWTKSDDGV